MLEQGMSDGKSCRSSWSTQANCAMGPYWACALDEVASGALCPKRPLSGSDSQQNEACWWERSRQARPILVLDDNYVLLFRHRYHNHLCTDGLSGQESWCPLLHRSSILSQRFRGNDELAVAQRVQELQPLQCRDLVLADSLWSHVRSDSCPCRCHVGWQVVHQCRTLQCLELQECRSIYWSFT